MTFRKDSPGVGGLFGIACLVASTCVAAAKAAEETSYERLSGEIIAEALVADEAQEFHRPPTALPPRSPPSGEGRTRPTFSVAAAFLPVSDELGASREFAGSGSALGLSVEIRTRSRWGWSMGWLGASQGVYSDVDRRPAAVERYVLGANHTRFKRGPVGVTTGAGLAYNRVNIDSEDPGQDIEGFGGYLGLRMSLDLATRFQIGAGGKLVLWRGEDGLGDTAGEMSLIAGLDLSVRF